MTRPRGFPLTRRELLIAGLAAPAVAVTGWAPPALAATPPCDDGDEPTPRAVEGPFFTPDSPRRTSLLEPGIEGPRIVLAGTVLSTGCRPVAGALLDFWHADAAGEYDNVGYRLRGHQYADGDGRYRLTTVLPGRYGGRTPHFHVKVQAPGGRVLTTQLYFPGEPGNRRDALFNPALLVSFEEGGDPRRAAFDFVLDL